MISDTTSSDFKVHRDWKSALAFATMAGRKAALALRVPKNTEELLAHATCPEVLGTVVLQ